MSARRFPLPALGYRSSPNAAFAFGFCADILRHLFFDVHSDSKCISVIVLRYSLFDVRDDGTMYCNGCLKPYDSNEAVPHVYHALCHPMFAGHSFIVTNPDSMFAEVGLVNRSDLFLSISEVVFDAFAYVGLRGESPCSRLAQDIVTKVFDVKDYVLSSDVVAAMFTGYAHCRACNGQFFDVPVQLGHLYHALCHADSCGFFVDAFVVCPDTRELILRRRA